MRKLVNCEALSPMTIEDGTGEKEFFFHLRRGACVCVCRALEREERYGVQGRSLFQSHSLLYSLVTRMQVPQDESFSFVLDQFYALSQDVRPLEREKGVKMLEVAMTNFSGNKSTSPYRLRPFVAFLNVLLTIECVHVG